MLRSLSKSFLLSVCVAALAIGLIFQSFSDHRVFPPIADRGSKDQPSEPSQSGGTDSLAGRSYWTGAVRLESGEVIPLRRIELEGFDGTQLNVLSHGGYLDGLGGEISIQGIGRGNFNGNRFQFSLPYNSQSNVVGSNRSNTVINFEGQATSKTAEGNVLFVDEYRTQFKGTFALVPDGLNVQIPLPKDPGGSGSSVINGKWHGQLATKYNERRASVTLDLHQQQQSPLVSGTGTIDNQLVEVHGNVAGSSFNLRINNSVPYLIVGGQVTQDKMETNAEYREEEENQGTEHKPASAYGTIEFTR